MTQRKGFSALVKNCSETFQLIGEELLWKVSAHWWRTALKRFSSLVKNCSERFQRIGEELLWKVSAHCWRTALKGFSALVKNCSERFQRIGEELLWKVSAHWWRTALKIFIVEEFLRIYFLFVLFYLLWCSVAFCSILHVYFHCLCLSCTTYILIYCLKRLRMLLNIYFFNMEIFLDRWI